MTIYGDNAAFLADIINSCFNKSSDVYFEKCALLRSYLKKAGLFKGIYQIIVMFLTSPFLSKLIEQAMLVLLVEFSKENNIFLML